MNWDGILEGNTLAGVTYQAIEKYVRHSNCKGNEIGWLLLSTVDALGKDDEKLLSGEQAIEKLGMKNRELPWYYFLQSKGRES